MNLDDVELYMRSLGRLVRITAIFTTEEDANNHCAGDPDAGVIAVADGLVLVANIFDSGLPFNTTTSTNRSTRT